MLQKKRRGPTTNKDIDAVVFRRVVKRLISDRVPAREFDNFVAQARTLLEEAISEARYEKFDLSAHAFANKRVYDSGPKPKETNG